MQCQRRVIKMSFERKSFVEFFMSSEKKLLYVTRIFMHRENFFRSSRPEVFFGEGVLKICSKFTGEHPCRSVISIRLLCNKFTGEHPCRSVITLRHGCSPVNLQHIFRTPLDGCFSFLDIIFYIFEEKEFRKIFKKY